MIIFADVLGLYKLPVKTVLCYIHTLQSQVTSTHVMGMCKLPAKFYVGYIHYKAKYHMPICWGCVSSRKTLVLYT